MLLNHILRDPFLMHNHVVRCEASNLTVEILKLYEYTCYYNASVELT